MIWEKVIVDWCDEYKCWTVSTYDNEGNRQHFSEQHLREWAIDDAKILAFEDQVGPQRAPKVEVYSKANRLIKTICDW